MTNKPLVLDTHLKATREEVEARIEEYLANAVVPASEKYYPTPPHPSFMVEYGRRYAKVICLSGWGSRHVHTFIDLTNGDILKAGSWKAPAPNGVRGNIFASDYGASVIDHYGAKYLR